MERYYIRRLTARWNLKICGCNREILGLLALVCWRIEPRVQFQAIFFRPRAFRCVFTIEMAWGLRLMNLTNCEVEQPRGCAAVAGLKSWKCRKSSASARSAGNSECLWLTSIFLFFSREFHRSLGTDSFDFLVRKAIARLVLSLPVATVLFLFWLLASLAWPDIPVGRCVITIAVSTLFRCCPPGPLPRVRFTEQSLSSDRSDWLAGCWDTLLIGSILKFGRFSKSS